MKYLFSSLVVLIVLASCSKNSPTINSDIVGNWKAIQWLNDPGDGSGRFVNVPLNSNYYLNFKSNGDFEGNYLFEVNEYKKYSVKDSTIITLYKTNNTDSTNIYYEFVNAQLIVSFMCIEPCRLKLVRD